MALKRAADTKPSLQYSLRVGGRGGCGEGSVVRLAGAASSADLGGSSN